MTDRDAGRTPAAPSDRERWDAKHEAARARPIPPPDPFVLGFLERLQLGRGARVLELACGAGRHSVELARRGHFVEAWDVSPVGLRALSDRAEAENLTVSCRVVDLVAGPLPAVPDPYDLVVVVSFLDRPLYGSLAPLVRPGGHVIVCTFTEDRPGDVPGRAFCLARGELARGLRGFTAVRYEERGGRAALLARRA